MRIQYYQVSTHMAWDLAIFVPPMKEDESLGLSDVVARQATITLSRTPLSVFLTQPFPVRPRVCVSEKVAEEGQKSYVAGRIMEALRASQADSVTGR